MNCPLCGISINQQKHWRQCPREKETVCTKCCSECISYNNGIHRCMYRTDMEAFIKAHANDPHAIVERIKRNLRNE